MTNWKIWAGALALALGLSNTVSAETALLAMTSGNATAAVATVNVGESVDVFVNGVYDQVIELQEEIGSVGSGAWRTVANFEDIAPAANTLYRVQYASTSINQRFRAFSRSGSGTAYVNIVTDERTPTAWSVSSYRSRWRVRDDFFHGLLPITTTDNGETHSYIVHIGAGNAAVLSVIEGQPEGAMTFSNGDAGTDADLSTGSVGLLAMGHLVSDGTTSLEWRLHMSQITDANVGFGLVDLISAATEIAPFEVNSNVVAEGAVTTVADAAVIYFDTDADIDQWHAVANNTNTIQNNADEYELGLAPVATTYQVFRIEIDSEGDCTFYINDLLRGAMGTCVATTAVLIPYWWAGSAQDATGTVNKINVDYIEWTGVRPSG